MRPSTFYSYQEKKWKWKKWFTAIIQINPFQKHEWSTYVLYLCKVTNYSMRWKVISKAKNNLFKHLIFKKWIENTFSYAYIIICSRTHTVHWKEHFPIFWMHIHWGLSQQDLQSYHKNLNSSPTRIFFLQFPVDE